MGASIGGLVSYIGSVYAGTSAAGAAGSALAVGATSTAVGAGLSAALAPKAPNITIPPPPGATMIDPAGSAAAASSRQRAAAAGGLGSTQTGAGLGAQANAGPTGGGKTLLGQ